MVGGHGWLLQHLTEALLCDLEEQRLVSGEVSSRPCSAGIRLSFRFRCVVSLPYFVYI